MTIIIRSENIEENRPADYVENIIMDLDSKQEIDLIGLGNAVFYACSVVKLATDLSNIGITEITANYLQHAILGKFEGIFFVLSTKNQVNMDELSAKMDEGLDLTLGPIGQLIFVPKKERPSRITIMALIKLRKFDRIKIVAAGGAINSAISVALTLVHSNISKEPVFIEAITLSTVGGRGEESKFTTGINIYLSKGKRMSYSDHHKQVLANLTTGTK